MAHDTTHTLPDNWEPGTDSDLNVPMILFISAIGIVLLVVIVFYLRALYYQTVAEEVMAKLAVARNVSLSDLRQTQLTQIQGYSWVDARAGTISMPIDQAMELIVSERAAQGDPTRMPEVRGVIPGDVVFGIMPVDAIPAPPVQGEPPLLSDDPVEEPEDEQAEVGIETVTEEGDTETSAEADEHVAGAPPDGEAQP